MRFKRRAKRKKCAQGPSPKNFLSGKDPLWLTVQAGETSAPPPETPLLGASFERFTSLEVEVAYRTIFSLRSVLGEQEVSINDFPTTNFELIHRIFVGQH